VTGPAVIVAAAPVVELAHALVADVAGGVGLRALVVKGDGASHHGLRPPRVSADVDVLLRDRGDALRFGAELARRGWRTRPADADLTAFPRHSDTWFHPGWSCDLDVHHRFPGLDDDPGAAFDALWAHHEVLDRGGRDVAVPCRVDTLLLLALHCLRSPWVERHADEHDRLVEHARALPVAELVDAARRLRALAPLRPFVEDAAGRLDLDWGTPSAEWRLRTLSSSPLTRRLVAFRDAGARERLHAVRLALLPPRETLVKDGLGADLRGVDLLRAYLVRWARGLRGLPAAWRDARRG
jgi:hypothetical protein